MVPGLITGGDDLDAVFRDAAVTAEIGERFHDADLVAFALHVQGRVRIRQGLVAQGMALLDEAMVAVLAGELSSPLFTGLIYCQVIGTCEEVFEVRRARSGPTPSSGGAARNPDAQLHRHLPGPPRRDASS